MLLIFIAIKYTLGPFHLLKVACGPASLLSHVLSDSVRSEQSLIFLLFEDHGL